MQKRKSVEQLDFEIAFYERLLAAHPDFPDALMALGESYTRRGRYDQGLAADLRLTQVRGADPVAWYNLACSYALLSRSEESFEALQRALSLGYDDVQHLLHDPDLALLRKSPKLRQLLEQRFTSRSS